MPQFIFVQMYTVQMWNEIFSIGAVVSVTVFLLLVLLTLFCFHSGWCGRRCCVVGRIGCAIAGAASFADKVCVTKLIGVVVCHGQGDQIMRIFSYWAIVHFFDGCWPSLNFEKLYTAVKVM
jgi:hypothetical protein